MMVRDRIINYVNCLLAYFLISLFKNKMRGPEGGPERGLKGAPEGTNAK